VPSQVFSVNTEKSVRPSYGGGARRYNLTGRGNALFRRGLLTRFLFWLFRPKEIFYWTRSFMISRILRSLAHLPGILRSLEHLVAGAERGTLYVSLMRVSAYHRGTCVVLIQWTWCRSPSHGGEYDDQARTRRPPSSLSCPLFSVPRSCGKSLLPQPQLLVRNLAVS